MRGPAAPVEQRQSPHPTSHSDGGGLRDPFRTGFRESLYRLIGALAGASIIIIRS
jgi:hypothetical protein